jgi:hypothetical protein
MLYSAESRECTQSFPDYKYNKAKIYIPYLFWNYPVSGTFVMSRYFTSGVISHLIRFISYVWVKNGALIRFVDKISSHFHFF